MLDCVDRVQPSETHLDECQRIGPIPSLVASEMGSSTSRTQEGMREMVVLFLRECRRVSAGALIRPADSQRVHAVLEHPAADSQQVGGMGLDIVCSL